MNHVSDSTYDLWFDANAVDGEMVVDCWISHGPRAVDERFDPRPGDLLTIGDGEEPPIPGRVLARDGDRVTVRVDLGTQGTAVA